MRKLLLALIVLACLPQASSGQVKPVGTFELTACDARPSYVSFAMLADWRDFDEAADCAERTGLRYVLALYGVSRYEPVERHARAVKARADAAGLTPYLVGIVYHEEWYEYALTPGALPIGDLAPERDIAAIVRIVHWWVGQQHAVLGRVFPGLARVWLTGLVNDDPTHGPALWRPVPSGVEIIALETYVPTGLTWATPALYFSHLVATRREPIVLVAQAFVSPGDPLWGTGPTDEAVAGFGVALRHPRVIAGWLFDWKSRPGITGLSDLPQWQRAFELAVGWP